MSMQPANALCARACSTQRLTPYWFHGLVRGLANSKKSAASKAKSAALAAAGKKSVASATTPAASKKVMRPFSGTFDFRR